MRINPNPKCLNCSHYSFVFYDGDYGCKLVGFHHMCILPEEPFVLDGLTLFGPYYDEYCIDSFTSGSGECKFYKEEIKSDYENTLDNTELVEEQ